MQLGIQGFLDPAPCIPKALRIRYLFREQMHYTEIPDYMPTVLPQSGSFDALLVAHLSLIITTEHRVR